MGLCAEAVLAWIFEDIGVVIAGDIANAVGDGVVVVELEFAWQVALVDEKALIVL